MPLSAAEDISMQVPTLYQFFHHQVRHGFLACGYSEPATVGYVSDVLARFAQVRQLFALRDAAGRPLEHIVDMLEYLRLVQDPGSGRRDNPRVRWAHRHIGEYTLFMSGLFRERLALRGQVNYYVAHGAGAFSRCADYESHPARRQLFRRLHDHFGRIADMLDGMRRTQFPWPGAAAPENMLVSFWRV
jgi:hypothetical protein